MKHLLNISFQLGLFFLVPTSLSAQSGTLASNSPKPFSLYVPTQDKQDTSAMANLYLGQPWGLQECISYAQVHNISVQQQQLNVKFAQASLLQSEGNMLPNVNGFASHTYNNGRTIDPFTNTFATSTVLSENFGIRSSITLFAGLQNVNTYKQNQFSLEANRYQVLQTQYDIGMNVASAYLNVLYTQEALDLASQQSDLTQAQVERMQKLVEAGAQAKGTLLDLQSQLATEAVNVVSAQNSVTMAYLNLTQLMNLDSAAGFSIVKPALSVPNETILSSTPEQIYQTAVTTMPSIKKAQMDYQSADKGVDIAYGGVSPSVVLSGSLGTGYSGASKTLASSSYSGLDTIGLTTGGDYVVIPKYNNTYNTTAFGDQFNNNVNKSVGLSVNIPIFNHFQVNTTIAKAKIQRENAQLGVDLTEQQLHKNISQAYADAQAAFLKYTATQKAVDAAKESFKYTENKFNLGALNSIDYNNAKNNLAKAESSLVQSKYDYIFRMKVLDYYMGKPLTF
ncbi:MAG: TolC family protein [Bacteroidetes bacterium]|nr:TolC family protein [Bacteroidota bacterium]